MDTTAVRPIDPAELPEIVRQAVAIADECELGGAERELLLPLIYGTLTARVIFPGMQPQIVDGATARRILGGGL